MKTAEEWASELHLLTTPDQIVGISTIEEIQNDAYKAGRKAGMREAAQIVEQRIPPRYNIDATDYVCGTGRGLKAAMDAILTAADAKEGK